MTGQPRLLDRELQRVRRARADRLGYASFLLDRVAREAAGRLALILRDFALAADIGTPGAALRDALRALTSVRRLVAVDPLASRATIASGDGVAADPEALPFAPGSFDLAVSALALHAVDDLPGALLQIRQTLRADGLFLAALFGGDTLTELRQAFLAAEAETAGGASPHVAPFADLRDLGALLQRAGFALPVTDLDRVVVRYDSAFDLMQDLRRMGATNTLVERARRPLGRATLLRMAAIYAERFSDADGRVRATFDIVWLSGWAPHASQQQPLRPGSAKSRLADALNTREIASGEKPDRLI